MVESPLLASTQLARAIRSTRRRFRDSRSAVSAPVPVDFTQRRTVDLPVDLHVSFERIADDLCLIYM